MDCVHQAWLRKQSFADHHLTAAFDHSFDAVLAATAARDRLDEQILDVAASARFADPVNRLGCSTRHLGPHRALTDKHLKSSVSRCKTGEAPAV